MPRFEEEGYNPNKRMDNDKRDRSVPIDDNYFGFNPVDLDFNNRKPKDDTVRDNQPSTNINDYLNDDNLNNYYNQNTSNNYNQNDRLNQNNISFDNSRNVPPPKRNNNNNAKPPKKSKGKNVKSPKMKKGKRIILSIISIILVIVVLLGIALNGVLNKIKYDDKVDNQYVKSSQLMSSSSVKNILLLGVDARPNDKDTQSRSDSMMLVSIDSKNHTVKMVSFLRDTWVYIPCYNGDQRLNAACTYGGYNGVVDTIEYNFGVKIDGYVVTNFEMFKTLVDSIDGVTIDVTQEEADEVTNHPSRYGNVKLEAGKHKLTGKQALAYCRIRKIDTDFVRAKRQRTVMTAIIKKVKSSNPATVYKMASNSAPYIETNLSKSQLKRYGFKGLTAASGDMLQTKVPFENTWEYANISGNSVIAINKDKNKQMLIDYLYKKTADEIKSEEKESK